jgi:protein-L-isoaspartate(D-aspartate) O-methyltransferase
VRRARISRAASAAVLALAVLAASAQELPDFARLRQDMVEQQLRARGITDSRVLKAMGEVPRHLFVPEELQSEAYADKSLPVGKGSTIHQPYVVALMTTQLKLDRGAKVLEVGTGSGYHAAVLGRLARQVFTIEIDPELGRRAKANLQAAGVRNVHTRIGDGYLGWPEEGLFDAIILTAAPKRVPPPLFEQLRVGGILVLPEGGLVQNLVVYTRTAKDYERKVTVAVSLPKMTGKVEGEPPR